MSTGSAGPAGGGTPAGGPGDGAPVAEFMRHRDRLFGIAYWMTGSVADAEDLVQETWLRWNAVTVPVARPGAYLARTVTNLALDRLGSAAARRERYVGPWLPEPLVTAPDASDEVERAEAVSLALLVVLESLSPLERAAFVLREVFGYSHREIAEALDRSEASVRQLARRARSHVEARRPRYDTSAARQRRLTEQFLAAAVGGDVGELMRLLAPDVTVWADGGGKRRAALRPLHGADRTARWALGVLSQAPELEVAFATVNGQPGILATSGGEPDTVAVLDIDGQGRIAAIRLLRNPDKLSHLRVPGTGSGRPPAAGQEPD